MNGPAAKRALNPEAFLEFVTGYEYYIEDDQAPRRTRLCINSIPVTESDARMIRRWRTGKIEGITIPTGAALLRRYGLTPFQYAAWCARMHYASTLRGNIRADD